MKKIVLILSVLFLLINVRSMSQDLPAPGSYIVNNTMSPFHGTWQWTNGVETFKIFLVTKKVFLNVIPGGFYMDCLTGWHIYTSGTTVIESSYGSINIIDARTFLGGNEATNPFSVSGTFKDISKNKDGELTMALNGAQNQLSWHLEISPGIKIRVPHSPPYQVGFTVPVYMTLQKL